MKQKILVSYEWGEAAASLSNPENVKPRANTNNQMYTTILSLIQTISHRNPRDVSRQGLEVVEGGGGVPHDEVDGDEEAAEDDAEGAGDDGEDDVFLKEDWVPRRDSAGVRHVSSSQT